MRGVPKITKDDDAILEAINAFHPVTVHTSNKLRLFEGEGIYVKIGPLKAFKSQYDRLVKDHEIKMAEHFRSRIVGSRTKYYGYRLVKSRFGESVVDRYFGGSVKRCDNEEAKAFFDEQARSSMNEVIEAVNDGDLERAKKIKRTHVRAGTLL